MDSGLGPDALSASSTASLYHTQFHRPPTHSVSGLIDLVGEEVAEAAGQVARSLCSFLCTFYRPTYLPTYPNFWQRIWFMTTSMYSLDV
jgi:hypothetical protein